MGDSKQTIITMDPSHYPAAAPWDPTTGVELPTYIQNSYQLLDQPGEWYLDHAAETLYYIPQPRESMKTATIVVPVLQTLVQGNGTLDAPIHDIQFKGLAFEYAGWTAPTTAKGFVMNQANFGYNDERMPANVVFTAARHIVFQQDVFTHLGAAGLDLYGGSQNNLVDHCVFTDISGSGIQLGGIDDPDPSDVRARDSGNQITNNLIDNVADEYYGGIGIFAGYVANTIIAHNEIAHLPYSGISLGWGWAFDPITDMVNNQITHNHVHHVMQLRGDGGGIYTNGPQTNSIVQGNYVHDVIPIGIYEDEGSSFIETSNNVVTRTGDWVYIWNRNIHDLKVHDNFTDTRQYTNNGTRTFVTNTTVVNNGKWPAAAAAVINSAGIVKQIYTSLFTSRTPVTPNVTDGVSHELGTKFQSSVGGTIQAIRYYTAPGETGTHIGRIWDNSGHLLASVTFTNETASGWQTAYLSTPLTIRDHTTYIVTVNANRYFASTVNGLSNSVTNGPLSTVADGAGGVLGPIGKFPKQSNRNSNYFRDVLFVESPVSPAISGIRRH